MNLQKNTINALEQFRFDGVKKINITGKVLHGALFSTQINLSNGISFYLEDGSKNVVESFVIEFEDGKKVDIASWAQHNFYYIKKMMQDEDVDFVNDLSKRAFSVYEKIYNTLYNENVKYFNMLKGPWDNPVFVSVDLPAYVDKYLFAIHKEPSSVHTLYREIHSYPVGYLSDRASEVGRFINFTEYTLPEEERGSEIIESRDHYGFFPFLMNLLTDIDLKMINSERATFTGEEKATSSQKEYILYGDYSMVKVDKIQGHNNITRVVQCEVTGHNIMERGTGGKFPHNVMGRYSSADGYISDVFLNSITEREECPVCGTGVDVISTENYNFVVSKTSNEFIHRFVANRGRIGETTSHSHFGYICEDCSSNTEGMLQFFEKYDGRIEDGYYIDEMRSFSLGDNGICSYNYEPYITFFRTEDEQEENPLYMGVEIEMDGGGQSDFSGSMISQILSDDGFAYNMHDGSLYDGFEMATMPGTLKYHMEVPDYKRSFELAVMAGYRAHDTKTCGLHVHINRDFFGRSRSTQNLKAAFLTLIMEKNWGKITEFSRRNYDSLYEWAQKRDLEDDIEDDEANDTIAQKFMDKYDDDKYVAVNTQHRETFELRIFRGTLKTTTYLATLQFVSNLAHIAKSCTNLAQAQKVSFEDIINYKRYAELDAYVVERNLMTLS